MDQAQKIFPLQRGDCCLAFCGDAMIAYPFFVQAASSLNAFARSRTRADDIHEVAGDLERILNNLIGSWDAEISHKREELADTRILFCGWSWRKRRFIIGFFKFIDNRFTYLQATENLSRPWKENVPSLIVLGDYRPDYMRKLSDVLHARYPGTGKWLRKSIDLQFEPLEALNELLLDAATPTSRLRIGGAPQAVKIYPHSNVLPLTIRRTPSDHFTFGRELAPWEKTEFPVADLSNGTTRFLYPMKQIPRPADLRADDDVDEGGLADQISNHSEGLS
jgi:hypothetical protein